MVQEESAPLGVEELFELERPVVLELINLTNDKELLVNKFKSELLKRYGNDLVQYVSLSDSNIFALLNNYTKQFFDIAKRLLLYNDINYIVYKEYTDNTAVLTVYYKNGVRHEFTFSTETLKLENVKVYLYKYDYVVILDNVKKFDYVEALARIIRGVI